MWQWMYITDMAFTDEVWSILLDLFYFLSFLLTFSLFFSLFELRIKGRALDVLVI